MTKLYNIGDLIEKNEDQIQQINQTQNPFFYPNIQNIQSKPISASVVFNCPLDKNICDLLIKEMDDNNFATALTGNLSQPDDYMLKKIRKSEVYFLDRTHWANGIVWNYIKLANDENWQYDISDIQSIQVTKYTPGGFYNWHTDFFPDKSHPDYFRKLSMTIQLNDPSEYEGGILQIFDYHNKRIDIEKKKGSICVFEGRTLHRVTKIKSGVRYSLVAWILGPQLK